MRHTDCANRSGPDACTAKALVWTILISLGLVGCSAADSDQREAAVEGHKAHWGYAGKQAPEQWAHLDPDYALCGSGTEQSPIDLTGGQPIEGLGLERLFGKTVLSSEQRIQVMDIINNGHTIQVTLNEPMSMQLGETIYEFVQFHFHEQSEHTIDGKHSPLEIHFVHKSAAGKLAVLSVLVESGEHNEIIEPIIAALPERSGDERHLEGLDFDVSKLRPLVSHYYRYSGSLTTPPCSEGVEWIVFAEKREISEAQLEAIQSRLHNNRRPVQPLGDRALGLISTTDSGN
jgi:carbonic anhydrase